MFSQHNLRSAAPSSGVSSTSAPPAPSEADLFAPVSPSAAPNAPTANAQTPQTPPNAPQTPSDLPPTSPNTAPTGTKPSTTPPEHPADTVEHSTDRRKIADFIDANPVRGHQTERNAAEHIANTPERSANAVSTPSDDPEHGAQRAKNADFIDADPVRGHKTERNAAEHDAQRAKNADFIDAEHPADDRKRHDPAPEHPAYDPDAGQRVLRSAAHRRAVRAEREACCGALRHLAHCCVAF